VVFGRHFKGGLDASSLGSWRRIGRHIEQIEQIIRKAIEEVLYRTGALGAQNCAVRVAVGWCFVWESISTGSE
jgi:hypothetical protein